MPIQETLIRPDETRKPHVLAEALRKRFEGGTFSLDDKQLVEDIADAVSTAAKVFGHEIAKGNLVAGEARSMNMEMALRTPAMFVSRLSRGQFEMLPAATQREVKALGAMLTAMGIHDPALWSGRGEFFNSVEQPLSSLQGAVARASLDKQYKLPEADLPYVGFAVARAGQTFADSLRFAHEHPSDFRNLNGSEVRYMAEKAYGAADAV